MMNLRVLTGNDTGIALIFGLILWGMSYFDGVALVYVAIMVYSLLLLLKKRVLLTINLGSVLFFTSVLLYFWGILVTGGEKLYGSNVGDIYNIVSLCLIYLMVNQLNQDSYKSLMSKSRIVIVGLMGILSILALYKYYMLTRGVYLPQYYYNDSYIFGTSLIPDNNMFALAMLVALMLSLSLIKDIESISGKIVCWIAMIPITGTVVFSGSRRSYVFILILYGFLLLRWFYGMLSKVNKDKLIRNIYFFSLVFVLLLSTMYASGRDFNFKRILDDPQIQTTILRMSTIQSDNFKDSFLPRTDRWSYAFDILGDSSVLQIILGRGFDYLTLYVDRFPSKAVEDYPHNPIISTLLYSGVFGVSVVLLLLAYSVYSLIKYRRALGKDFVLIYIATFLFIIISGNSIFTYKIFLFMVIITIPAKNYGKQCDKLGSTNRIM